MRFSDYIDARSEREKSARFTVLEKFAPVAGVSLTLIRNVYNGARVQRYDKAKAISEATGGVVTIAELCE